jgi:two-component system cell cycle response regulator
MKVLIAEDSATARITLERTIAALGHECLLAEDGAAAWEVLRHSGADVVISDWIMPGMHGDELCRKVRERSSTSYTYFILLTSLEDAAHVLRGMDAGADGYLKKPFDRDDLVANLIAAERVTALHERLHAQQAELEHLNRRLFEEARLDPLTGVGNRVAMNEHLTQLGELASRYGHTYSIALYDIDRFKSYNDTRGHLAGDQVLKDIADELVSHCRGPDKVYRFGGEELLVVFPEQLLAGAGVAAERLRTAIETLTIPHGVHGPEAVLTISGGVAQLQPSDDGRFDPVLGRADAALYRAKEHGRNRVELDHRATPH